MTVSAEKQKKRSNSTRVFGIKISLKEIAVPYQIRTLTLHQKRTIVTRFRKRYGRIITTKHGVKKNVVAQVKKRIALAELKIVIGKSKH